MEFKERTFLRSLQREAGRQLDFYDSRKDYPLAQGWADLEALVTDAIQHGQSLELILKGNDSNTPIIKPCEQGQQLPNHNVIKALQ